MAAVIDAVRVAVEEEERASGVLSLHSFDVARRAMLDDGMVVLDDLVPADIVDAIRGRMHADIPALEKAYENRPNRFPGQLQQAPPSEPEYLHTEVLSHPVVLGICRSLLGVAIKTILYSANTNMPGSTRQEVHCDLWQLWPDLDPVPRSPFVIACNLPLIDTNEHNAIELWPGTHLDARTHRRDGIDRDIPHAWLDERRAVRPPLQVPQKKGSVLLRDARLWHTGVTNTSNEARVMLVVGYAPAWYSGFALPVPETVATFVAERGAPAVPFDGQQWAAMSAQYRGIGATVAQI